MKVNELIVLVILVFIMLLYPVQAFTCDEIIADVQAAPYNVSDYELDVFDCSNMAMLQHDWLTAKGHIVYIHCGANKTHKVGHAWLQVDGYMIEATTKDWAHWYYETDVNKTWYKWDIRGIKTPRWDDYRKPEWRYDGYISDPQLMPF